MPEDRNAGSHDSGELSRGEDAFPVVGLGASAGGLEAFEAFFEAMPGNSGMAFVLVVHLDPSRVSLLPELVQKHTAMPVAAAEDGMAVRPDHVYVIPPNQELAIARRRLRLLELPERRGTRLPIDAFFRSLAEDQGRWAVGVVLSGTGTDGTLGLKAIKGEMGLVLVQDEDSAKYDGMPRSAAATHLADYVLPAAEMPRCLVRYARGPAPLIAPENGEVVDDLQKIFATLRTRVGHDFSLYKKNTLYRRIERRMHVHQIDTTTDYVRYLRDSPREVEVLFKELLIGVTNFFRDPEAFESLKENALVPLLAARPADHTYRVWVAGCSTGEEAYSVAIALSECLEDAGRRHEVQIFGTDLDADAIAVARHGVYAPSIAQDVSPERLKRYFTREDDGRYRIRRRIREMLVFAPQNVVKDPPFTRLDLLSCRNLLIYLDTELQHKLLPLFRYSLHDDGILFLGSSESVGPATDHFSRIDKKWKIYRSKARQGLPQPAFDLSSGGRDSSAEIARPGPAVRDPGELSAYRLVEAILRQSDAPPCVVIDEEANVVYVHGRTGPYLEAAQGQVSVNLLEMARPGLRTALSAAVQKIAVHPQVVACNGLRVPQDGGSVLVDVTVRPLHARETPRGFALVTFHEKNAVGQRSEGRSGGQLSVKELEEELLHTRENLQTTIEELETSNEELKSSNEELQSTNEELQSTNEEMETSKEELQSLNEESITVNAELQSRIDELSEANDDLRNLLDSTDIATVFLDTALRVRRFTPRACEIVPLAETDAGRPLRHFSSSLKDADLVGWSELVLKNLETRDEEVRSKDGRTYRVRIRPYRTVANVIDGIVLVFDDITELKNNEEMLRKVLKDQENVHAAASIRKDRHEDV